MGQVIHIFMYSVWLKKQFFHDFGVVFRHLGLLHLKQDDAESFFCDNQELCRK
jgi:hypothetical protein